MSVKVDMKHIITENHKEFVRIKRKVIQRISRKVVGRENFGQDRQKISVVDVFKKILQGVSWKRSWNAPQLPVENIPAKEKDENDWPQQENEQGPDNNLAEPLEKPQEAQEKPDDLYMPLQF